MKQRLFHLIPKPLWGAFWASGEPEWKPASLLSEGFAHLSFAHQLPGTLEVHFAATAEVILLELDPRELRSALVVEASRGGELFPHLYRAPRRAEMRRTWELEQTESGWNTPELGSDPASDRPRGSDLDA